jgi:adenosine deaminase CECR1
MFRSSQLSWRAAISDGEFESTAAYDKARDDLKAAESSIAFDAGVVATSSVAEQQACEMVQRIRAYDQENTYGSPFDLHGRATGKRSAGHHFLGNVDVINETWLMDIAQQMPKGAHLHLHFNSCLPAKFLIQQARDIDAMYIRSTHPLTTPMNMVQSRISFMVLTFHEATHILDVDGEEKAVPLGNIFDESYISNTWMPYKQFQDKFKFVDEQNIDLSMTYGAELWLASKMQISEEEAHSAHQTSRG